MMKKTTMETWPPERSDVGLGRIEKVSMFKGFWKHLGVTGSFFIGISLFWLGVNIMLNDWVRIRDAMGPIGNMALAPLFVGLGLSIMSFIEFRRLIREYD